MNCPEPITQLIAKIIQVGILQMRADGFARRPERCAIEADHIHNLPALLVEYRPELLEHYWYVERPAYIDQSVGKAMTGFEELWKRLEPHVGPDRFANTLSPLAGKQAPAA